MSGRSRVRQREGRERQGEKTYTHVSMHIDADQETDRGTGRERNADGYRGTQTEKNTGG